MGKESELPVALKVTIDPEGLRRVVDQGRLLEFANTFSTLAAAHIKVQLVEQLAKGAVGLAELEGGLVVNVWFDVDDPYGTPPKPWPWPFPRFRMNEVMIREMIREELAEVGKM
jgi:hypothetical protein